jgi:copper(I)-binding protein
MSTRLLRAYRSAYVLAFLVLAVDRAAPATAQQVKIGDLVLNHAWARATPGGAKVGGGYLTIENRGATLTS